MDLLIYGYSGFGFSIAEIAIENGFHRIGIFDENKPENLTLKDANLTYLGKYNSEIHKKIPIIIAIGNNEIRAKIASEIKHQSISIIHKSAYISQYSKIENGCIIMQNIVIQSNTFVNKHCIINTSSIIDHDCEINDFVHIRPLLYIGSNSKISKFSIIQPNSFIERYSKI